MTAPEPAPLWREVVIGDTEPWRRGRLFLVAVAILSLLSQGFVALNGIIAGYIEFVLVQGIVSLLFWFQFYFIWIGIHWVRWFNGGLNALYGFALIIWGFRDGNTISGLIGVYSLVVGCYMAFAPSVYFFAKRQRETVRRGESLAIAFVSLVLFGTLVAGIFGLVGYRAGLEREARAFADIAFRRIFTDHDTQFLFEHASDRLLKNAGGRAELSRFLQGATMGAGDVHDIHEPTLFGPLRVRYSFPLKLVSDGTMTSFGMGQRSRIRMMLIVGDDNGEWQIHEIRWWADYSLLPPSQ
jgi:hypothetical protein